MSWRVERGDCRERMAALAPDCIDAVCTDPPYGIDMMAHEWDSKVPGPDYWAACLRVLKPGGHLVAFGSARTYHHLAVAIEQAGFEIRDQLLWLRSHTMPTRNYRATRALDRHFGVTPQPGGVTAEAQAWQGWGTATKAGHEPIVLARKPLAGTVAENLLDQGVGGLNIDGCRVPGDAGDRRVEAGRFPANVIHDGSPAVVAAVDGADRFFYCARASRGERDAGLDERFPRVGLHWSQGTASPGTFQSPGTSRDVRNPHPAVKPTALCRYLVRLVCPADGWVLDPFAGSGSMGRGAVIEGMNYIGHERDLEGVYVPIARARITHAERHGEDYGDGGAAGSVAPAAQAGLFPATEA